MKRLARIKAASVAQVIVGILFVLFTIVFVGTGMQEWQLGGDYVSFIFLSLFTLAVAAFLCWKYIANTNAMKYFKLYVPRLAAIDTGSIEELAGGFGRPIHKVKKDLELLIKKHLIVNAYIDHDANRIIFTDVAGILDGKVTVKEPEVFVSKVCQACGAPNKVPLNGTAICAYCGTPLR